MDIEKMLEMVESGHDSAMLRLMLARLYTEKQDLAAAAAHLESATVQDPGYTAAWKELGKLRKQLGDNEGAIKAWQTGITVADEKGDKQAGKEMTVFLRRLLPQGR